MKVKELIQRLQDQVNRQPNPDKQEKVLESEVMVSIDPGLQKYPLYRIIGEDIIDLNYQEGNIQKIIISMDGWPNNDFHEDQD